MKPDDDLDHYMERLIEAQEEDAAPFPEPPAAEPLPDRLVEFARDRMHRLVSDFDDLRMSALGGRLAVSRLAAWRERLVRHLCWEVAGPLAEYARRRPACDEVEGHAAEHRALMRQIDELFLRLEAGESGHVQALVTQIQIALRDHLSHEVDEICYPLDHALDNPTIEALERMLPAA